MTSVTPQAEPASGPVGGPAGKAGKKRRARGRAIPPELKRGARIQAAAAVLWLPQAALLAYGVGQLADTGFDATLYYLAAGLFLIGCLRSVLDERGAAMAYDAARAELTRMREKAVFALSRRSPLDRSRPASGEAASMLAEQAEMIVPYLSRFAPVRFRVMLLPLVILAVVLWFSWVSALILFIAAPLIPIFMALIGWRAQAASEKQLVALGDMNGFLLDRLRGLATIRSFHAVDMTALRLRANAETLRAKTMNVLRIAFLSSAVLELFSALGVAMVAVYIGFHLLGPLNFGAWGDKLTLAEGLFILLLSPAFFEPLRDLSAVWHDKASGEAAIDALEELSRHDMSIIDGGSVENGGGHQAPSIVLRDVDFAYAGGANILTRFDLDIEAGEHVAVLAPSGYGKSTLLALIAGLAAPQKGKIEIGGVSLEDETAAALRKRMRWVGQKPHIFAGSARHNITLGRPVDAEQTRSIVGQVELSHVIGITGNGLIGENGAGLSGGEALRLALARIAVDDQADIILADEPTAHLDHETARRIADSLLDLAKGKTLIISTHDEMLARRLDRIVRLDDMRGNEPYWPKRAAE